MGLAAAAAATTSSGDGARRHRPLLSTEPVVDSGMETGDTEAAALRLRAMLHDDDNDTAESSGTWVIWAWDVLDVFMATAVRSFTVFLVRLTAAREAWMLFVGAGAGDGDGRGGVS
jgi:hypothetical protein